MGRGRTKPTTVHNFGKLEVALNVEDLEILTMHLSVTSKVCFVPWMWCETLAQRHKIWHWWQTAECCQMLSVLLLMPPPNSRSWSSVLSRARLDISPPGWPPGSAVLTSVVSISVLGKGGSSFLKEKWVQTGDTIVLQAEQSLALPGFAVLQQSEICCSQCDE